MKRVLIIAGICLATSLGLRAADEPTATEKPAAPKHHLTDEQKTLLKEMTTKYDANKDGKLDKEERQKISADDKERMKKAGLSRGAGKGAAKPHPTDTDTTK